MNTNGSITVWDDYGAAFTLDASKRAIIQGNEGFLLRDEDFATVATIFQNTLNGDGRSNALEASPPPPPPVTSSDSCTGQEGNYCAEIRTLGGYQIPDGSAGNLLLQFVSSTPIPTTEQSMFGAQVGAFPTFSTTSSTTSAKKPTKKAGDVQYATSIMGGPTCYDIANQIYTTTKAYKETRTKVYGAIAAIVSKYKIAGITVDSNSVTSFKWFKLPTSVGIAEVALEVASYNHSVAATQLTIYAAMYAAYGCWTNPWVDATGTLGGTGSRLEYVCRNETWELSRDGGATWTKLTVSVCEYQWHA